VRPHVEAVEAASGEVEEAEEAAVTRSISEMCGETSDTILVRFSSTSDGTMARLLPLVAILRTQHGL